MPHCTSRVLHLTWNDHVVDASIFSGVWDLSLQGCDSIVDVSMLGGVHRLDMRGCRGIRDISALGKVRYLDISYCEDRITTWMPACYCYRMRARYVSIPDASIFLQTKELTVIAGYVDVSILEGSEGDL